MKTEPIVTNEVVNKQNAEIRQRRVQSAVFATATVIAAIVAFIGPWEGRRYLPIGTS